MSQYHINSKGNVGICKAESPETCPLGGQHFTDPKLAQQYYENLRKDEDVKSLSKSNTHLPTFEIYNPNRVSDVQDNPNSKPVEFPLYVEEVGNKVNHVARRTREDEIEFKKFIENFSENSDNPAMRDLHTVAVSYFESRFSKSALTHLQRMVKEDLADLSTNGDSNINLGDNMPSEKAMATTVLNKVRLRLNNLNNKKNSKNRLYFYTSANVLAALQYIREDNNKNFLDKNSYSGSGLFTGIKNENGKYYLKLHNYDSFTLSSPLTEKEFKEKEVAYRDELNRTIDKLEISLSGYIRAKDLGDSREDFISFGNNITSFNNKIPLDSNSFIKQREYEKINRWDRSNPKPEKNDFIDNVSDFFKIDKSKTYKGRMEKYNIRRKEELISIENDAYNEWHKLFINEKNVLNIFNK